MLSTSLKLLLVSHRAGLQEICDASSTQKTWPYKMLSVHVSHILLLSLLLDALHWLSRRPVQAGKRLPLILRSSKCRASAVGAISMPRLRGRPWQTQRQDRRIPCLSQHSCHYLQRFPTEHSSRC